MAKKYQKIKNLILIFICSIILTTSLPSLVQGRGFNDLPSWHQYYEEINFLADWNVIWGYDDGSFKPDQTINRAELITLVMRSQYDNPKIEDYSNTSCFEDIPPEEWFTGSTCLGWHLGIVQGYPGTNEFKPAQTINSAEALKIIFKTYNWQYQEYDQIWYQGIIEEATKLGFTTNADHQITRGEVAFVLAQLFTPPTDDASSESDANANPRTTTNSSNSKPINSNESQTKNTTQAEVSKPLGIPCNFSRSFDMIVVFDENSYSASDAEIKDMMDLSSDLLYQRTCTGINLLDIIRVEVDGSIENGVVEGNAYEVLPEALRPYPELISQANGFMFFTEFLECSHFNGGCAYELVPYHLGVKDYCNEFPKYYSIENGTDNGYIYGGIVDWMHMYAMCGYDDSQKEEALVRNVSGDGECRNISGQECVFQNGYSMCPGALNDYKSSDPRLMTATTIVHEIMHMNGEQGNMDHDFSTPICEDRYQGSLDEMVCQKNSDGTEVGLSECFFNICQYTYENFMNNYESCS